jgi:ubiquinone/menaquinone biosynthesis C-methylase UbiE
LVIGVDKSPYMLAQASLNRNENCLYVCGAAEALPIVSESVSVAFASMVLEHVEDKDRFFSEASRILKADGVFILRTMLPEDISSTTWYSFIPSARHLEMRRTLSLTFLEELARRYELRLIQSRTFTDVIEATITRQLPDRLLKRSYEILAYMTDAELNDAVAQICLDGLVEKTSSSLLVLHKCH